MNIPEIKNNTIYAKEKSAPLRSTHNSNVYTKDGDSTTDKISKVAKEIATDMIPIYGTINAFKQGKTGWGIFGIVTDILMIVPAVGLGVKLLESLAKKSSFAIRARKISANGSNIASSIIKEGNIAIKSESIPARIVTGKTIANNKENNIATKIETNSAGITETGEAIANNSETIDIEKINEVSSNKNKKFTESLAHAADKRLTTLYNEGKILYKKGEKIGDKVAKKLDANVKSVLPHSVKSAPAKYFSKTFKTVKDTKWKDVDFSRHENIMAELSMNILFREFKTLKAYKLDSQFMEDVNRNIYEINGKISNGNHKERTMNLINKILAEDPKKAQLISVFANRTVFSDMYNHLMKEMPDLALYKSKNNKVIFKIDTMDKDTVRITGKLENDLIKIKGTKTPDNAPKIAKLKKYGLKMEMILSPEKAPKPKYYVYVK